MFEAMRTLGVSRQAILHRVEICDALDNDCDGMVDDACVACEERQNEICDYKDNDCDGQDDEGCPAGPIYM